MSQTWDDADRDDEDADADALITGGTRLTSADLQAGAGAANSEDKTQLTFLKSAVDTVKGYSVKNQEHQAGARSPQPRTLHHRRRRQDRPLSPP